MLLKRGMRFEEICYRYISQAFMERDEELNILAQ